MGYRGRGDGVLPSLEEEAMEETTLIEVKNDGQTLVLMDGRELSVDPRDIATAMLWLPTTRLEISHTDVDPLFNLLVKVSGTNEEIRASWR
jgi:hypothetical protein